MTECPVCAIPLARYEACPSPACPCFGTRCGSDEMEHAAAAWRSRPSRAMTGADALAALDRDAWLDMMEVRGRVISIEIEHNP